MKKLIISSLLLTCISLSQAATTEVKVFMPNAKKQKYELMSVDEALSDSPKNTEPDMGAFLSDIGTIVANPKMRGQVPLSTVNTVMPSHFNRKPNPPIVVNNIHYFVIKQNSRNLNTSYQPARPSFTNKMKVLDRF